MSDLSKIFISRILTFVSIQDHIIICISIICKIRNKKPRERKLKRSKYVKITKDDSEIDLPVFWVFDIPIVKSIYCSFLTFLLFFTSCTALNV